MWIKDKSVEPKVGQLYVVAFQSDGDYFEHDLAYVSNAIIHDGEANRHALIFECFGGEALELSEIEAYMPVEEYSQVVV